MYDMKTMKECANVTDSIRMACSLDHFLDANQEGVGILIASMDNSVKIINYSKNSVKKIVGLKNYVNCCHIDTYNDLIWVGSLDGSIACFAYKQSEEETKHSSMTLTE